MAIPDGTVYTREDLGAGKIATTEDYSVNTEVASDAIGFGQAVAIKDGQVSIATSAPIYGVALKRTYTNAEKLDEETVENDKWQKGETLGVLRDGTISVPVSADVAHGDSATVDANGNFKTAGASDTAVGVFLTDGNAGSTAQLQIRVALGK